MFVEGTMDTSRVEITLACILLLGSMYAWVLLYSTTVYCSLNRRALCVLFHMFAVCTLSLLILQVGAVDIEPTWSTGMINFVFDTAKFPNVTEMVCSYISWGCQVYNSLFVTVSVLDCVRIPPNYHMVWAQLTRKVLGMWLDSCVLSGINKWHPLCSSFMNYHTRSYNFKNLKETDHTSDHYTSQTLLTWDTRAHYHGDFFPMIFS